MRGHRQAEVAKHREKSRSKLQASNRTVLLEVWSPEQQQQQHLGTC